MRLRRRLPGHPGGYNLPCSVANRGVADRTDHRVRTTGCCPTIGARTGSTPEP
jgi:hypothetical protein